MKYKMMYIAGATLALSFCSGSCCEWFDGDQHNFLVGWSLGFHGIPNSQFHIVALLCTAITQAFHHPHIHHRLPLPLMPSRPFYTYLSALLFRLPNPRPFPACFSSSSMPSPPPNQRLALAAASLAACLSARSTPTN
jgi:hypothetical protein